MFPLLLSSSPSCTPRGNGIFHPGLSPSREGVAPAGGALRGASPRSSSLRPRPRAAAARRAPGGQGSAARAGGAPGEACRGGGGGGGGWRGLAAGSAPGRRRARARSTRPPLAPGGAREAPAPGGAEARWGERAPPGRRAGPSGGPARASLGQLPALRPPARFTCPLLPCPSSRELRGQGRRPPRGGAGAARRGAPKRAEPAGARQLSSAGSCAALLFCSITCIAVVTPSEMKMMVRSPRHGSSPARNSIPSQRWQPVTFDVLESLCRRRRRRPQPAAVHMLMLLTSYCPFR